MSDGQSFHRVPDSRANVRLESWKEIAQYLGREVRTVQRWEKLNGLPVRRLYHARRGRVYAFPHELDEWWNSRGSAVSDDEALNEPAVPDEEPPEEPSEEGSPVSSPRASFLDTNKRWAIPAICLLVVAAGVSGWLLRNSLESRGPVLVPVTNFPGDEENPALSPDGQQAAFSWTGPDGGNYDIYVIKIGQGSVKRVTTAAEWDYSPVWSPTGDKIAFLRSNSATLSGTRADIFVVDPNGGPERKIGQVRTIGVNLNWKKKELAWTPDGKSLVVCGTDSDDPEGLLLIPAEGGPMRRLTLPPKGQFDLEPTVSPDGRLVAFRRETSYTVPELFVVPLGGDAGPAGPERPIQSHAETRIASPQWESSRSILYISDGALTRLSTDADGIAVGSSKEIKTDLTGCGLIGISYEPKRPGSVLCTCERDDHFVWRLELPVTGQGARLNRVTAGQAVSISPDKSRIAVEVQGRDGTNVWVQNFTGGSPRRLTETRHTISDSPSWSPDGRWIAFNSTFEGRPNIYVAPADGGPPRPLTNLRTDLTIPSWSRDGKFVYFAARIDRNFEVVRMPAEGGEFKQITHGGGTSSAESTDSRYVYYNHRTQEAWSLRRVTRDGGDDQEVIPSLQDRAFAVTDMGIYFIPMPDADGRSSIRFLNFTTRGMTVVTPIQKPQRRPIVLSSDGSFLLFSQFEHWGHDLALLDRIK